MGPYKELIETLNPDWTNKEPAGHGLLISIPFKESKIEVVVIISPIRDLCNYIPFKGLNQLTGIISPLRGVYNQQATHGQPAVIPL